jgi:hypothetical protein
VALPGDLDPALSAEAYLDHLDFTAPAYLEVPRRGFDEALDVLATDGAERAKYRTGGVEAAAHPSEAELAAFVVGCARRRLPFKLTAGLHHALRTTTDEGFEQHGVLNVLAAADAAAQGAGEAPVEALLGRREVGPVAEALSAGEPRRARALFRSFGCCAPAEPLDAIARLGRIEEA